RCPGGVRPTPVTARGVRFLPGLVGESLVCFDLLVVSGGVARASSGTTRRSWGGFGPPPACPCSREPSRRASKEDPMRLWMSPQLMTRVMRNWHWLLFAGLGLLAAGFWHPRCLGF